MKALGKQWLLTAAAVASLLAEAAPAQAQSAGQWRTPDHVYESICAYCHQTGVGPVILGRKLDVTYVSYVVRHGRMAMPAFLGTELSAAEVEALARMIHDSASPAMASAAELAK